MSDSLSIYCRVGGGGGEGAARKSQYVVVGIIRNKAHRRIFMPCVVVIRLLIAVFVTINI
jgi:hypothetical protein